MTMNREEILSEISKQIEAKMKDLNESLKNLREDFDIRDRFGRAKKNKEKIKRDSLGRRILEKI